MQIHIYECGYVRVVVITSRALLGLQPLKMTNTFPCYLSAVEYCRKPWSSWACGTCPPICPAYDDATNTEPII